MELIGVIGRRVVFNKCDVLILLIHVGFPAVGLLIGGV